MERNITFYRNTVLAVVFLLWIGYGAMKTDVLGNLADVENAADHIEALLPYHDKLINLSGYVMQMAGVRSYYNQELGINVTRDGYVVSRMDKTTTDYEIAQITQLKEYLDERGVNLLYVNEPAKYIDDSVYRDEFGGESYLNRNADLFLARLQEAGIEYVDLRDNIEEEGIDSFDLFYRTDHHWNVPAAKWAAEIIAEKLNNDYGYDIDLSLYADDNFSYTEYTECWLGEQGKKIGESYIGLDDFTLVEPVYETSFLRYINDEWEEGDFNLFIDYDTYVDSYDENGELKQAKFKSWHYSYNGNGYIQNNNIEFGNVLILGDSYERSLIPFLSLGIRNIYKIEPRYRSSGEVLEAIDSGDYDTVILTYAQFMIGAHDSGNANCKMFSFFD